MLRLSRSDGRRHVYSHPGGDINNLGLRIGTCKSFQLSSENCQLTQQRVIWVIIALIIPFRWTNSILRKLRADIRRLHATLSSPLSSLYTDTIDGVIMIRAFGLQDLYNQSLITLKDQEVKVGLLSWFGVFSSIDCQLLSAPHADMVRSVSLGPMRHQHVLCSRSHGHRFPARRRELVRFTSRIHPDVCNDGVERDL